MDPNFCPIPDTSSHSASVHWPTCQEPSLSFGPEEPIPYRCIQNAFCAQAAANPEHTAVVDHYGQSLTYKQLDVLSLHLALHLRGQGVTNGSRVCLLIERSNAYIIAILAVLRAGAAYIPLDGGVIPGSSLTQIMRDAQPTITLISKRYIGRGDEVTTPHFCLEDMIEDCKGTDDMLVVELPYETSEEDIAYIIYTSGEGLTIVFALTAYLSLSSGTTGQPKGVIIKHLGLTNRASSCF